MKTGKKALLLALCAVLLVAATVMGTMAYLTASDSVENTFTVGNVAIKLDEAKVGTDGKALTGEQAARVDENSYKLMPGHEYDKDPTVTVLSGSDESYIRLRVTVNFDKALTEELLGMKLDNIFKGYSAKWVREGDVKVDAAKKVLTYEYRYDEIVAAPTADVKLPALFTGIEIPGEWTKETLNALGNFTIDIVAEAIQKDGFDTADDAWTAFENSSKN